MELIDNMLRLFAALLGAGLTGFIYGELSSQVQHLRMIQLKWCPVT